MRKYYPLFLIILLFSKQLFAQVPTISSFSPASGPVGTIDTITGSNFSSIPANNIVFFGAVRATVNTASANLLTVTVPPGATFQPMSVTVNGLTAFSAKPFIVTFPGGAITATSFAPKIDYPSGQGPSFIATGDLDGDSKPDLVSVSDSSNIVTVFRNVSTNGTISLSSKIDISTGIKSYSVVVGDLDGDGKPDLALANATSNTVSLFRNTSSGVGNISFAAKIDLIAGSFPASVVISDLNGDGKSDIGVLNSSSNTLSVFKNNSIPGLFSFSTKSDLVIGTSGQCVIAGDLDNDSKPELVVINSGGPNVISIFRNTGISGNISFATRIDFAGSSNAFNIMTRDIDGDRKSDLIVVTGNSSPSIGVLRNISTGPGNISFASAIGLFAEFGSFGVGVSDMDGDSKPDIVAANSNSSTVTVLKNNSDSGFISFVQRNDFAVGYRPWMISLVDLDGDSKPEIASANHSSANISVLKNTVSDLIIKSFSPATGIAGTKVTITGLNFIGTTAVSFGGVPAASFIVDSSTSITAIVDTGATGNVQVTKSNAFNFLPGFTFISAPIITSFSPTSAGSGDTLTITGNNFSGISAVNFGGTPAASYYALSNTTIKAIVGEGASGKISATTIAGTALLDGFVYDNTPFINSISPAIAPTGATVVIKGRHFTGTSLVTFGGVSAVSFSVNSPNEISAVVGPGASGNVTVTNAAATAILSGFTYIPPPSINSFTPTGAGPLDTVIIIGNSFTGTTSVTFGNVLSNSFTVNSNTSISAVVPGGASGKIKVTANGSVDSIAGFKYVSPPVPVINSFTPLTGAPGTLVTISGSNFSPIASGNIVYFGAVRASVISASATGMIVKVPASASYCPISVTTDKHLTVYASQSFVITFSENEDVFTSSSFASKVDYRKDDPKCVLIHDLNGDGKPDLIVGNSYATASISIYKNISADSVLILGSKVDYEMGNSIQKISVEDIDGDGQPDLILTYGSGPHYISVYRNISTNSDILFDSGILISSDANYKGAKIGDIDGDGKPDLAMINFTPYTFSIFRNVSTTGKIVFAEKINFPFYRGIDMAIGDLDNDKKAEVIITDNETDSLSVYRNTSSMESISFAGKINYSVGHSPWSLSIGDYNGDNKNDIAVVNYGDSSLSVLKNLSTNGQISFAEKINFRTMRSPGNLSASDLDGDGKPDLIVGSTISSKYPGFISVFKNNSSSGQISFKTNVDYYTGGFASNPAPGDLTGDGRPDFAVANGTANTVSILINKIGKLNTIDLCAPSGSSTLSINIAGLNYQWQLNTGAGFNNIVDNVNYVNSNTPSLQLINIPSSWYGYKYRCVVDGNNSETYEIKFSDTWTGVADSDWNNSSNWTCGTVPDSNTDVIINSGVLVINSNVTIRSLKINPGANVTVNPGFKLVVLH